VKTKRHLRRKVDLTNVDGRTFKGRMIRELRHQYAELVGGNPDVEQRDLIDAIIFLTMSIQASSTNPAILNPRTNEERRDADRHLGSIYEKRSLIKQLRATNKQAAQPAKPAAISHAEFLARFSSSDEERRTKRRGSYDPSDLIASLGSAAD
jgi:hypothetical protein